MMAHKLHCNINNRTVGLAEGECNCYTHHCLWCGAGVDREGDTCCFEHYEYLCVALAAVPYLREGDTPPNDLTRQPWSRKGDDF